MSTPAIAALTRLTAGWADPPRIVTVGRKPAAGLWNSSTKAIQPCPNGSIARNWSMPARN